MQHGPALRFFLPRVRGGRWSLARLGRPRSVTANQRGRALPPAAPCSGFETELPGARLLPGGHRRWPPDRPRRWGCSAVLGQRESPPPPAGPCTLSIESESGANEPRCRQSRPSWPRLLAAGEGRRRFFRRGPVLVFRAADGVRRSRPWPAVNRARRAAMGDAIRAAPSRARAWHLQPLAGARQAPTRWVNLTCSPAVAPHGFPDVLAVFAFAGQPSIRRRGPPAVRREEVSGFLGPPALVRSPRRRSSGGAVFVLEGLTVPEPHRLSLNRRPTPLAIRAWRLGRRFPRVFFGSGPLWSGPLVRCPVRRLTPVGPSVVVFGGSWSA